MTPRQQTAITFPCARAYDTIKPKYQANLDVRHEDIAIRAWSTILTVNK